MSKEKDMIPENWTTTTLGDIITLEYGKSLVGKNRIGSKYIVWGSNGMVGRHNSFSVEGPIIIIGRKGSVGTVNYSLENCWPIDTTYFINYLKDLDFFFVFYLLKSLNLWKLDTSTTIPGLNRTSIYEKKILLPPINEQHRIVEKLEEIFSAVEQSKQQLDSTLKQLNIYRQSILKNAFEGKLTNKWRQENPDVTPGLLLGNLKEQANSRYLNDVAKWREDTKIWVSEGRKNKKPLRPSKLVENKPLKDDEIGAFPPIPQTWQWVKNNELLYYVTSGSRDWKKYYSNHGAMFIRTQDIKTNSLALEHIASVELPQDIEGKRSLVQKGDLLMTITGANVGKIAYINEYIQEAYVSQSVALMKPIDVKLSPYLHLYFQSIAYGGKMISGSVYGVGRPVLSLENIRDAPVALPPLEEQLAIVEEVEFQLTIIKNIEQTILKCSNKLIELQQSALKSAFRGSLVNQDPEDEHADVLLKRIKENRKEYYASLKYESKTNSKPSKMSNDKDKVQDILSILINSDTPISAKQVWEESIYKNDIEQFYSELKKVQDQVIETSKGFLFFKHEDR